MEEKTPKEAPPHYDYKKKFGGKIGYPTEYKKPSNFPRGVSATADQTQSELVDGVLPVTWPGAWIPVSVLVLTGGPMWPSLDKATILRLKKKKFGGKIGYPTEYKKPSNFPRGVSATAEACCP
jgi:hypothetical protein